METSPNKGGKRGVLRMTVLDATNPMWQERGVNIKILFADALIKSPKDVSTLLSQIITVDTTMLSIGYTHRAPKEKESFGHIRILNN